MPNMTTPKRWWRNDEVVALVIGYASASYLVIRIAQGLWEAAR